MTAPVLAVGDGARGFWKAVRKVLPAGREQRCWFHKQANVLAGLPKSAHPGALAAIKEICNAEDIDEAQVAIKRTHSLEANASRKNGVESASDARTVPLWSSSG